MRLTRSAVLLLAVGFSSIVTALGQIPTSDPPPMVFNSGKPYATSYRYDFKVIKPSEATNQSFEDAYIKATFPLDRSKFSFAIENKSDAPLFLDWNRASYVDTDGQAHRVIHTGIRFIEKDKEIPPSVIPPGATVKDVVLPVDYIEFATGWVVRDMLPEPISKDLKGKSFSIFLPLQVNGQQKYYNFVFAIDVIEVARPDPKKGLLDGHNR